jgi:hypothetical protein
VQEGIERLPRPLGSSREALTGVSRIDFYYFSGSINIDILTLPNERVTPEANHSS